MNRSLRVIALRGALGGLMVAGGLLGAPAFARGNGHEASGPAMNAHAQLEHTPTGTASLMWDKTGLTASLSLSGLVPTISYTADIKQGSCNKGGTAFTPPLSTGLTADANGDATGKITGAATNPIPGHGWYVAVSQGTTMVACGNIRDAHPKAHQRRKGAETANTGTASAKLGPTKNPNQDVEGQAHLHLKNGTLTVDMHAHGLTAGDTAEIRKGTCATPGVMVYPLTAPTQHAHGDWVSDTTIPNVTTIPQGQWYVAVWSSSAQSDLLACGNVKSGDHN